MLSKTTSTQDFTAVRRLYAVPEGYRALHMAQQWRQAGGRWHMYVAQDELRAARLQEALGFFAPDIPVFAFPAWDCLPYDRVSPKADVVAQRVATLCALSQPDAPRGIVITTLAAVLQKVPGADFFRDQTLALRSGQRVAQEMVTQWLAGQGYHRCGTVREPGEFAVRGDILDLFPAGLARPCRLDFFGDVLEKIRVFDPATQRTEGEIPALHLLPVAEFRLDAESVQRFRTGYRALFGAAAVQDPIYAAISAGQLVPGIEHWLSLLHSDLVAFTTYLPGCHIFADISFVEAARSRQAQVQDFYAARCALLSGANKDSALYKPVPPERMFLSPEDFLADEPLCLLSAFSAADVCGEDAGVKPARDFADARVKGESELYAALRKAFSENQVAGRRTLIACTSVGSRARLLQSLTAHGLVGGVEIPDFAAAVRVPAAQIGLCVLGLEGGFQTQDVSVHTEAEILGTGLQRRLSRKRKSAVFLELSALNAGDLVVHAEHGVGRYLGLETLVVERAAHDCVRLEYDGGDKLFVPVEHLELLSRYGGTDERSALDKLGGAAWQQRKARVKRRLLDMAEGLLKIAADRLVRTGDVIVPDSGTYAEFCARFPYAETEDQEDSIAQVLDDLAAGRPMDRLVCGDVGFGKTEVALRAAFVVAHAGYQVAVIVPTTLLARQHARNFRNRFSGFPFRVAQLSRFISAAEAKQIKQELAEGKVDIIIGTHSLLAKDVAFKNLALVILDEEQHFGVKQKEKLKELRHEVHMLTLTATPIPRTLQLALSGARDLSLITTPPVDRLAVRTFLLPFDPLIIREAILREHYRGGQVFYVCPRIEDLAVVQEIVRSLVPEVRVQQAHGQMPPTALDAVMTAFDQQQFDVLLSTNIVESGLDIPNANTLIIHRADLFGLAQLYQLRGRVGRGKVRGYAYLTWPMEMALAESARQRLQVMETLDTLGAGFQLASHDLDLRGAGNLLGEEQSGHIREVGIELYQQMLEDAVAAARAGGCPELSAAPAPAQIQLGLSVLIPEMYVPDLNTRMTLYRRLAELDSDQALEEFAAELIDRFGPLPPEAQNLLDTLKLKLLCRRAGVAKIEAGERGIVLAFQDNSFAAPERLVAWLAAERGLVKLRPDHRLVSLRASTDSAARLKEVQRLLGALAGMLDGR